jgi:hypothetical protein
MASYPGPNVHRPSRRKLGRGQTVQKPTVSLTVTSATTVATIDFSQPVVINGDIDMGVTGGPVFVSQEVVSPTRVRQTFNAALAAKTYAVAAGDPAIATFQGGQNAAKAGTF